MNQQKSEKKGEADKKVKIGRANEEVKEIQKEK